MKPVRFAVVGAGHMGRLHAAKIAAHARETREAVLVAVADVDRARAVQVAALVEELALVDPADRLEDEALAVRLVGDDARAHLVHFERLHALELEVDDFGLFFLVLGGRRRRGQQAGGRGET